MTREEVSFNQVLRGPVLMCICHSSWDLCVIIFNVKKKKQKKKKFKVNQQPVEIWNKWKSKP